MAESLVRGYGGVEERLDPRMRSVMVGGESV